MNRKCRLWSIGLCLTFFGLVPLGIDWTFPNNAQATLQAFLHSQIFGNETTANSDSALSLLWSVFVSETQLGTVAASFIAPSVAEGLGRTRGMAASLVVASIGHLFQVIAIFPGVWPMLFVGRFVMALGIQLFGICFPIFLSEVSPPDIRGRIGSLSPTGGLAGSLLAVTLGLSATLGSPGRWPYAYLLCFLVGIPALLLCFWMKETPVYLAANGKEAESRSSLIYYRGEAAVEGDFPKILADARSKKYGLKPGITAFCHLCAAKPLHRPLTIALMVVVAYLPARLFTSYSTAVFRAAGFENDPATYLSLGMQLANVLAFFICFTFVDVVGRRPLILLGLAGGIVGWTSMLICQLFISYFSDTSTLKILRIVFCIPTFGAQLFLNIGIRPVFWFLIPELLPFNFRSVGKSFTICFLGLYGFILFLLFYLCLVSVPSVAYGLIALSLVVAFIYLFLKLPESKGKTPQEIFPQYKSFTTEVTEPAPKANETTPLLNHN